MANSGAITGSRYYAVIVCNITAGSAWYMCASIEGRAF